MQYEDLVNSRVLEQPTYEPGKPIEQVASERGLDPEEIVKLASNENPFGPSPKALAAAERALQDLRLYPDGGGIALRKNIALARGIQPDEIILGNGSNEIIELLGHAFLRPGDEVLCGSLSFVVYRLVALLFGAKPVEIPMPDFMHDLDAMREAVTEKTRLIFVASPNNPTGVANSAEELVRFARELPEHVIFGFDEAYAEYLDDPPDLLPLIREGRKVVCMRTFSKIHGLAGLRIGYGYGSAKLASLLHRVRQPFNANAIAQAAAGAALGDDEHVAHCRRANQEGMVQWETGCKELGLPFVPSQANFILVKVGNATKTFEALQDRGIIVRSLGGSLAEYLRITIGTREQNTNALAILRDVMEADSAN
ncbi:MAG: histidinol-phosphate transaminase [Opitutales bacterium]|nr:histidinol-phosphate transaminase [Opitutales bacterium]